MPASSLYCCQRSVSMISAAARNRRIAASPWVRPPLASASDGSSNRPPAPRLAAPTAAPLSRKDRRLVRSRDCSLASMSFSSPNLAVSGVPPEGLVSFHDREGRRVFHPREPLTSIAAYGKLAVTASAHLQRPRIRAAARRTGAR